MGKQESGLQAACMQFLRFKGYCPVKHNPFGGFTEDGTLRKSHQTGEPDIKAVLAPYGIALMLEIKATKGILTFAQACRLKAYAEAGAVVAVIRGENTEELEFLLGEALRWADGASYKNIGEYQKEIAGFCHIFDWKEIQEAIAKGK
mgnify:CR=1 FL=1